MDKNKYIISLCPNFYKIINYDYFKEDIITNKIINIYRSFIFNINPEDKEDVEKIKELDIALSRYINDLYFRKELQNRFKYYEIVTTSDIVPTLVENIIKIYEDYQESTRRIYIAKWI